MASSYPEYDFIVIGSGFGGSVSALRLTQKGYKVLVLEMGKRWEDKDFPETNFQIRKYLWAPLLRCFGIMRMYLFPNVLVLGGSGVGGGSLVYANTLLVPPDTFFQHPIIKKMGGKRKLMPYYEIAKKMLGVTSSEKFYNEVDFFLKESAKELGVEDTHHSVDVGVYYGEEEKDPYFYGEGPKRTPCNLCGGCMTGCRYNAKNTLVKNYLYFAEKLGAKILPERKVEEILPLSEDGEEGYLIRVRKISSIFPRYESYSTKGVVLSAGVIGTLSLLFKMKEEGKMPRISSQLGKQVRTNSEAIIGVMGPPSSDYSQGIAITSGVHLDKETHVENVRYGKGSDFFGILATILTDKNSYIPRPLSWIWQIIRHPLLFLQTLNPIGFARRTIILLVMQTRENAMEVVRKRRPLFFFKKALTSSRKNNIPVYIPQAHTFARILAKKIGGTPGSLITEIFNIPTTAHILGGCIMGEDPEKGVIDLKNRLFGYKNFYICDGSMIPANLGVNPSLSITAFTERAMSFIPPKKKHKIHFFSFEKRWKITPYLKAYSGR